MRDMKTRITFVVVCLAAVCASAQGLWRGRRMSRPEPLEPLLPFAEAVEKAKKGDAQGCYALAIHYAKGDEIERDAEKARFFLKEAAAADYGNAVLVDTICLEQSSVTEKERLCAVSFSAADLKPYCHGYIGTGWSTPFSDERGKHSLTNSADVAAIRAGYERAFNLGVAVATNELARFERRVSAAQDEAKKQADATDKKRRNAGLVNSILQDESELRKLKNAFQEKKSELRKRLNDPDADDDEGRTFTWTAGGEEGLSFDVFIRAKEEQGWHYLEKATITIDKDGRIIKIEGRQGRTEIQS